MRKLVFFVFSVVSLLTLSIGCSTSGDTNGNKESDSADTFVTSKAEQIPEVCVKDWVNDSVPTEWDVFSDMPNDSCIKLTTFPPADLIQTFRDSNRLHYEAAQKIGIEPIDDSNEPRRLERIKSGPYYVIDKLGYSYPYLVPEGRQLLDDIGRRFHDSMQSRGGGNYRLKVTSLLRTRKSVSNLRRVNSASVDSSAHLFGTTFDVCYTYFPYSGGGVHRMQVDMKNLLAEILYGLRSEGRCYVIYEGKKGCFHITARAASDDKTSKNIIR